MGLGVGSLVSLGGGSTSGSGGGGSSGSGIVAINNQFGPLIDIDAGSGIFIVTTTNRITIHASGSQSIVSKFAATFSSITSGLFTHGLGTLDVLIQVFDAPGGGAKVIMPDKIIIENSNQVSLVFNFPRTGKVVII